jgi:hypothetical protein
VAIYRRLAGAAFDDRSVEAMALAYEAVLLNLELIDRDDPLTEIIANKIIECAAAGERDVDRLRDLTLHQIRG